MLAVVTALRPADDELRGGLSPNIEQGTRLLQAPGAIYNAHDSTLGDLDGDGQYEVILLWQPMDAHDNSQAGVTGQTLIQSPDQHPYARTFLTEVFSAGACIISPIVIEERLFGALILLWAEPKSYFTTDDSALALGISDQLAIALSKARLSAEVLRLKQELESAQVNPVNTGLIGKSDSILRCTEMAMRRAASGSSARK